MKLRIIDGIILVAIVVGAFLAYRSSVTVNDLRKRYFAVVSQVGEMEISDPARMHVRAIKSEDPLSFAWRIYQPKAQGQLSYTMGNSSGSLGFGGSIEEFIARLRLTASQQGATSVFLKFGGSSSYSHLGSDAFARFLEQNQSRLIVEQLATSQPIVIEAGEPQTLLKLSMPDDLAKEAREKFPNPNVLPLIPVVIEVKLQVNP
jgi:hypothetical protein